MKGPILSLVLFLLAGAIPGVTSRGSAQAQTAPSCRPASCTASGASMTLVQGTPNSFQFRAAIATGDTDYPILQYCVSGTCSGPVSNCYARSVTSSGSTLWDCYDEMSPAIAVGNSVTYGFQICDNNFHGDPPYLLTNCVDLGLPYLSSAPTLAPYSRLHQYQDNGATTVEWHAAPSLPGFNVYDGTLRLNRRLVTGVRGRYRFTIRRTILHLHLQAVPRSPARAHA